MLKIHGTKLSQSKFSRMSWLRLAGIVSCCALTLVFGLMLFPSFLPIAEAAQFDEPSGTGGAGTSVGIILPASIDFTSVTPTPSGATTTATADLTITTSDSAGYSLYLYSSDGDNSLKPKISSLANISTINATAGDVGLTLSSLKPNTWGYNLGTEAPTDSTTYSAVPTDNSTPIQTKDTSDTNSANDTYTLSFGAKVDMATASGAYSDTLTIAVVAEPPYIPAFDGITTMQEMTSTICANAEENETTRLTDTRDGKQYWVAKLKDGNCWMTQNLELSLTDRTLTPADSDIATNWTPSTDNQALEYGDFVWTTPSDYTSCGSSVGDLSDCPEHFVQITSDMIPMSEPRTDGVVISGNTYDAHYKIGYYYSWYTAVANTESTSSTNASGSICPKGWRLPARSSFRAIMDVYGASYLLNTPSTGRVATNTPLYFVTGGEVYGSGISGAGEQATYWTGQRYSASSTIAERLHLNTYGPGNDYRQTTSVGQSVRCLAR